MYDLNVGDKFYSDAMTDEFAEIICKAPTADSNNIWMYFIKETKKGIVSYDAVTERYMNEFFNPL